MEKQEIFSQWGHVYELADFFIWADKEGSNMKEKGIKPIDGAVEAGKRLDELYIETVACRDALIRYLVDNYLI